MIKSSGMKAHIHPKNKLDTISICLSIKALINDKIPTKIIMEPLTSKIKESDLCLSG